ncbi:MAG TPA: TCR/Tet family MFS transporter [Casimicrobiaceae bacterium]|nr:TCR/Tet family MFS transporter [Casimicrobiaceae bacterium]
MSELPSAPGRRAGLPFILVVVFIDVLGIGLAMPVLPMLVGDYTASRELQSYWYGALTIAYGLMQFICAPLLGALSDRFGRRPVILASIFGLGLHYLLLALAPSLWFMLFARVLGGITGASFSVANAYASDVTPAEGRAKSFGLIGAAFGLGFICGPMLGGLLGSIDLHLPFYAAAGLALVNGIYGAFIVPESLPPERRAPFAIRRANPFAAFLALSRHREIGHLVVVFALVVLAQLILQTTWVLFTHFRFGWGPRENGFALFCVGLVAAVVQGALLGRLLRWFGEVRLALLGLAVGTVAYLAYGLATRGWMMYAIIVANFVSFAAGPALQGIVSNAVGPREQGVTMGALSSLNSIMFVVAPAIGTSLLAQVSHLPPSDWRVGATFYVSAMLQLIALFVARRHFAVQRVAAA